jgi:ribosomal protein S13
MSGFAFFRFMSNTMLTSEEQQHKDEVIAFTEDILRAKGIECDSKISRISQEQLKVILREVRKLGKKQNEDDIDRQHQLDIAIQLMN